MITANFSAYSTYATDSLFQWEQNRVLRVTGLNLKVKPEVHFSNANMRGAIPVQADLVNHVVVASIPNSLLQEPLRIYAHIGIYEGDEFKVVELVEIPVKPRKRPADYELAVDDYELYSFKRLENMIKNINDTWVDKNEEQVHAYVTSWLDEHPEATTTVQDGALTEAKFSDDLKLRAIKDYVTPQMFGAKGDGVTDDTAAVQAALDAGAYVFIPSGEYLISASLTLSHANQRLVGSSVGVKIIAGANLTDPMLTMSGATSSQYRSNQQVNDITFKGNDACVGIRADLNASFTLNRVVVKDCGIGFESIDALIYNVNECSFANCNKGIVFRAGGSFSPANNVKFSSCRIYECSEYAIQSEAGPSTHGVVFDGCEIEANNVDSVSACAILLQSTFKSGNCPMVSFLNCWFENNRGTDSVIKITNAHTNHPVVIFTGNVMLNTSGTVPMFINAEGVCLYVAFNHNPSEYSDVAVNLVNAPYYNFGCSMKHRTDETKFAFVLGDNGRVTTDLNVVNGKAVNLISPNGTGYNKVFSTSNHLKLESEKGKVSLNGAKGVDLNNSYEKPLIFGSIYMWANGKSLLVKYGGAPTAANDGTVLTTLN